jgi:hypothetical protein
MPPQYSIRPETEWLTVRPWWIPGRSSAALFLVGDGGLVDMSRDVPAGTYYLVTSSPELAPPEIVLEEGSYLEHDVVDATGAYYSILHIELVPGYELPELSIRTKGTAAPPILKFTGTAPLRHSLGGDIFVARLPSLRVLNWTADCANKYWLWINDGSGERRLAPAPDGSGIEVSVPCPSQGTIWLEQKHYIRGSAALQQLNFAVIPRGIEIHILEGCCGIDEPAHLQVRLPSGWGFEPRTQLQSIRPDLWEISAGDRVVDATLSYRDLKFSISLRIPRGELWFNAQRGDGSILWREDLSHDPPILVEGLPNTRCLIFWLFA